MRYLAYHHESMWLSLQSNALELHAVHNEVFMLGKGLQNEQKWKCWEKQLLGGVTYSKLFLLSKKMMREGTRNSKSKNGLGFNFDAHNMGYGLKHESNRASQSQGGGKGHYTVEETTLVTPTIAPPPPMPRVSVAFFHSNSMYYVKPMIESLTPELGVSAQHRKTLTWVKKPTF
ncbi:uncharacterized protein LOC131144182 [Malania oleifera]|uniref:uncharacterized protein LOC131144182 n=1 Tax=Malania oleifera TaxID=397392 RepID=UPI0025ADB915|nr:uncharacterized protein LOC131144182 [Malania oleifera]